jgi:hypothetical protein
VLFWGFLSCLGRFYVRFVEHVEVCSGTLS